MQFPMQHMVRSWIMLALFAFALIYQGMHQLDNPAEAPGECQNIEHHFHSDNQSHACEICDYQITHWTNPVALLPVQPPLVAELTLHFPELAPSKEFHQFSHRGPPTL